MRLIDADKLVKAIENENPGLSISGAVEKFARTAQVNRQPTIDAIPIEFIKQLIEKFDCERGNAIKDTFAHILTGLLEFWEFEQEKENE